MSAHKAGFVSIIGRPNVGKSSLMNRLVGENLSIITPKAQTTRHRIMGILNGENFQVVYSDTPGILEPQYELQKSMMTHVKVSLEDADAVLLVVEWGQAADEQLISFLKRVKAPVLTIVNKSDLGNPSEGINKINQWKSLLPEGAVLLVSARSGEHVDDILPTLMKILPEHPPYFPKDDLTNRTERFFASEIIREKIFLNYSQEIPYSSEVVIESFKDEESILRISALIFIERESQKGILIGKGGSALKKVGSQARKDLEEFFNKKVFLQTKVKVAANWRKDKDQLRKFGYFEN